MIVSSFSDPIALVCPPMVRESAAAEQLLKLLSILGIKGMQSRRRV